MSMLENKTVVAYVNALRHCQCVGLHRKQWWEGVDEPNWQTPKVLPSEMCSGHDGRLKVVAHITVPGTIQTGDREKKEKRYVYKA